MADAMLSSEVQWFAFTTPKNEMLNKSMNLNSVVNVAENLLSLAALLA